MRRASAFTLVELILVMLLVAVITALSAPTLARSLRERNLDQETARLLALTEYARDEARSQGIPMIVWINSETGSFGMEAKEGYTGESSRNRSFRLNADLRVAVVASAGVSSGRTPTAAEFAPDGSMEPTSAESIRMTDRFQNTLTLARTSDGWGYEIVRGGQK
jgi:type II secretion system protein H